MAMTINTNVQSLNAQRNLTRSQDSLSTSMQRLSSGLRVNSAKDDAAGLAIAARKEGVIRGNYALMRNANDEISRAQIREGTLSTATEGLQRMRELLVQASNTSYVTADRANLQAEYDALRTEVATMVASGGAAALTTTWNTTGVTTAIDADLEALATTRAAYGATMSQLSMRIQNLQIGAENESAARGRIMDADFAVETANLSRAQILQQAGTAMVAQANQLPQNVLNLLKG